MRFSPRPRFVPALALVASLLGCGDRRPEPTPEYASTTCEFDDGDRWSPSGGAYRRTAAVGSGDDLWFVNVAGIHASPDEVYIFDAAEAAVLRFGPDLEFRRRFGRRGEGPGELSQSHDRRAPGRETFRRVAGDGPLLAVFDGWKVNLFDRNGRFERILVAASRELGLSSMPARISLVGEGVLYGSGGYDSWLQNITVDPVYTVKYWHTDEFRDVIRLAIAPATVGASGVTFIGPNQARPLWAARGGCVVASDGESRWLAVSSLDAERVDTIALPLLRRDPHPVDPERYRGLIPGSGPVVFPEPSALRRVDDIVIDPDGNVWLKPIQPKPELAAGIEVIRLSLATGRAVVDTVPRFPTEFGEPGVFYATAKDELDRVIVERYERDVATDTAG